jgi:hypothetical protein
MTWEQESAVIQIIGFLLITLGLVLIGLLAALIRKERK